MIDSFLFSLIMSFNSNIIFCALQSEREWMSPTDLAESTEMDLKLHQNDNFKGIFKKSWLS